MSDQQHKPPEWKLFGGQVYIMKFDNKIVLITGSTTGIGAASARAFSSRGAEVIISGRNAERGRRICSEIQENGGTAHFIQADLSQRAQCDRLVQESVDRCERLDVVVNNAGVLHEGTALETDSDEWDETLAVNVSGLFFVSRAAVRQMIKQGDGCIVNTASEWGLNGEPGFVAYCASKGAVVQITRCMALDHAAQGIRVNSVCPGETHTDMLDQMLRDQEGDFDENLRSFSEGIPMRRVASPDEIANCIIFLASDCASYITGANLVVDGGNDATGGPYGPANLRLGAEVALPKKDRHVPERL